MARSAKFSCFEPYKLTGIKVSDEVLGHGSYATVLKLDYFGLQCAGKKIHNVLLGQDRESYTIQRFEEECHILSQVRHPNIVQFLGVHFEGGHEVPILVMELLLMNLTAFIEQCGNQQQDINYSILHDIAIGLSYLHKHNPPIIHRDLSSNNILLDCNLTAKISDLGMTRVLNLTPLQVSRMTQTPGTAAYMPPEVMMANPVYGKDIDVFSYGIMMIHILSGRWPEPQIGPSQTVAGKLIPVTEAQRRTGFLEDIGDDHPLMELILKCISNDPRMRGNIFQVSLQLAEITSQFPTSFSNKLEMLQYIHTLEQKKKFLMEEGEKKNENIKEAETQITGLKTDLQTRVQKNKEEIEWLNLVHTTEAEQLQLQIRDLSVQMELQSSIISGMQKELQDKDKLILIKEDKISRNNLEMTTMAKALQEKDQIHLATCEQLTKVVEYLSSKRQVLQGDIVWKQCVDLPADLAEGQAVVINNRIYCGGKSSKEYVVFCYDSPNDRWSSLPPLPLRFFGLGQINGELVAIGGMRKGSDIPTNEVYLYDASLERWKQQFISMPTCRAFPSVMSLKSAMVLVVCGGLIDIYDDEYTDVVEIFKSDVSQWFRADSLPTVFHYLSMVADGNVLYAIGETTASNNTIKVFYASLDDIIDKATQTNQLEASSKSNMFWNTLPSTPSYQPAAAVLEGHLLAIGGWETSKLALKKKEIYIYSSSMKSWVYINDLPAPRACTAIASLSQKEIIVIGGFGGDDNKVSTVYMGSLKVKI